MGHQADFVLVDGTGWRLHRARWVPLIYPCLVAGPDAATRYIETQARRDPVDGWRGSAWAEAGAVVDHVARRLLFYGNDILEDVPTRRAFLALLARTWPGWQVTWAYDGMGDIAAHVGVDRQIAQWVDPDERRMPDAVVEDLRGGCHLLTVRLADGAFRAYAFFSDHHTAWQGPALLDRLPGRGSPHLSLPETPISGLHVDVAGRRAGVWWRSTWCQGLRPALGGLWPGWTVTFWGDRYEEQIELCGGAVTVPPTDPAAALDGLAQRLAEIDPAGTDPHVVAITPAEWAGVERAIAALRDDLATRPPGSGPAG